jgi:hypothetical protein
MRRSTLNIELLKDQQMRGAITAKHKDVRLPRERVFRTPLFGG